MEYILKRTNRNRSITIWWPFTKVPTIYLSNSRGTDVENADFKRTMTHELVHVKQWNALGKFKFLKKYITRKGRLEIEAEAFATNVKSWWESGIVILNVQYVPGLPFVELTVVDYYVNAIKNGYKLWGVSAREIKKVLLSYVHGEEPNV